MSVTARLGHVLTRKYRIDQFLGAGGAGLVYAATHLETGKRVAVKFLRTELASQPEQTRRFVYEARTAAQLIHNNLVRVQHLDEDPQYGLFMVLELLHGESLDVHLSRVHRLSLEQTCAWLLPVMAALEHAHARGLLHRDVKPANIFLHEAAPGCSVPKLLDFGLARDMRAVVSMHTKTGQALGTPPHMSPEQARGDKALSAASDVWSMAVVIYRCVTGVEPFERGSPSGTVLAVANGQYTPLPERCPELPEAQALGRVVDAALRVDPRARTQSMAELRRQLQALAPGAVRLSTPPSRPPATPSRRPSQPWRAWEWDAPRSALVACALGLSVAALWLVSDAPRDARPSHASHAISVHTHVAALTQSQPAVRDAGAGAADAHVTALDPR